MDMTAIQLARLTGRGAMFTHSQLYNSHHITLPLCTYLLAIISRSVFGLRLLIFQSGTSDISFAGYPHGNYIGLVSSMFAV